jgi:ribosome-binding protein aMBF1 (putative translation factor)
VRTTPTRALTSHWSSAGRGHPLRAERDKMLEVRNKYAERLRNARAQLDELLGAVDRDVVEAKA